MVVTLAWPVLQSLTRVALGLKWKNPVFQRWPRGEGSDPEGNRRPASQDPVSTSAGSALDSLGLNSMNAELGKPRSSWGLPGLVDSGHVCLTMANPWGEAGGGGDPRELPDPNPTLKPMIQMLGPHSQRFRGGNRTPVYFYLGPTDTQVLSYFAKRV